MAKRWYVVHTYSGYENRVKVDLEHRIETFGAENLIVDIKIHTVASETPRRPRSFLGTCLFAWR